VALLSQQIRRVAITGRTDSVNAWFANRQGGRWAEQTIGAAFPAIGPAGPSERLRELEDLHRRGIVDDAELKALRKRLGM
jgi:hypothetical protein